jgi:BirA family biotin operon repressor/biotin-[acetyl-CoA-carboxylase] ligase
MNCILERVAETKSTNADLLERWRAGQLIDPVARIAHRQTAGKGRAGRTWFASPEDSMCFSLAFPFQRSPAQLTGLSLVVGMAAISGIAQACDLSEDALHQAGLRLKWPNDLLVNNTKVGGILIEGGQATTHDRSWMIIGVGINLHYSKLIETELGNQSPLKAGALDQILPKGKVLPDIEYLWLKLISAFEQDLSAFDRLGFDPFQHRWERWDAYQGQTVCISGAGKEAIYGVAKGIDQTGALLLQQDAKSIAIHAGDVSLRVQS